MKTRLFFFLKELTFVKGRILGLCQRLWKALMESSAVGGEKGRYPQNSCEHPCFGSTDREVMGEATVPALNLVQCMHQCQI